MNSILFNFSCKEIICQEYYDYSQKSPYSAATWTEVFQDDLDDSFFLFHWKLFLVSNVSASWFKFLKSNPHNSYCHVVEIL